MNKSVKYTIDVNNQGAITSVKEIDDSLIKLDNTVENVQGSTRQLGTTTKALGDDLRKGAEGIQGTTMAVTNLNRVVQDAPFGLMGISNNIEPLVSSFQSLRVQTGSATGALKQLAVSAFTGPGALITVTSLATTGLLLFGDQLFNTKKEAEETLEPMKQLSNIINDLAKKKFGDTEDDIMALFERARAQNEIIRELELSRGELEERIEQQKAVTRELMAQATTTDEKIKLDERQQEIQDGIQKRIDDINTAIESSTAKRLELETKITAQGIIQGTNSYNLLSADVARAEALERQLKAQENLILSSPDITVNDKDDPFYQEQQQRARDEEQLAWEDEKANRSFKIEKDRQKRLAKIREEDLKQQEAINKKRIEQEQQFTTSFVQFGMMQMNSVSDVASAVRNAMLLEVKSYLASALASLVRKAIISVPFPFNIGAATAAAATFSLAFDKIADLIPKFEQGGIVGGNRHSNGGTLVEAEQGEFIVNRNSAMQAPGLLNTINRDPNAASEIEALLSGQISRMNSANIGGGTTKVVLSMYDLNQAQQQFNQVQLQAGVL